MVTRGGGNDSKTAASPKVHPSMGDISEKLEPWSTLPSLQAAQQAGECAFQVAQFQEAQLV